MSRGYGYIKQFENEILEMKSRGLTQREIADKLGFSKYQIKEFFTDTIKAKENLQQEQQSSLKADQQYCCLQDRHRAKCQSCVEYDQGSQEKREGHRKLQLHSDQGFQYTSHRYFKLTQEYNITPSMSRRGNPYDNALAENFFSILKTECIYRVKLQTYEEARLLIGEYIHFYNHQRIQLKTKLTPLEKRCQFIA